MGWDGKDVGKVDGRRAPTMRAVGDLRVVGIGGTTRERSGTERVLARALAGAEALGADVELLGADVLDLPLYRPGVAAVSARARRLLAVVQAADGVIIASPGYHGTVSGLVKNAIDYIEELRDDERPYLDGRAVGCIALAGGPQAAVATLSTLRTIAHSLRGWPTPFGASLVAGPGLFGDGGEIVDEGAAGQLDLIAQQVVQFAEARQDVPLSMAG